MASLQANFENFDFSTDNYSKNVQKLSNRGSRTENFIRTVVDEQD